MNKIYGYIRISSEDLHHSRYHSELQNFGASAGDIFTDLISKESKDTPELKKLLDQLKPGDLLAAKSLLHLGESYQDILKLFTDVVKEKEADICILDLPVLDTRKDKEFPGHPVTDLVIGILSCVSKAEKSNLRKRRAEGIADAKARGVRFGKKPTPIPEGFPEIYHLWRTKEITPAEAIERSGLPPSQFYWMARKCRLSIQDQKNIEP